MPMAGGVGATVRRIAETAVNVARELADSAPADDYTRLAADLALSKQCETSFKVFRDGGRILGITALATLGEEAERHHDEFNAEAGRLLQQLFVETTRSASDFARATILSAAAHPKGVQSAASAAAPATDSKVDRAPIPGDITTS
jgi:hypothetical protein